jgi:hypothetical protein
VSVPEENQYSRDLKAPRLKCPTDYTQKMRRAADAMSNEVWHCPSAAALEILWLREQLSGHQVLHDSHKWLANEKRRLESALRRIQQADDVSAHDLRSMAALALPVSSPQETSPVLRWVDLGYLDNGLCPFACESKGMAACWLPYGHDGEHTLNRRAEL